MEITCKIPQNALQRIQKRAEWSVLVGRHLAEPWADGAVEFDVQLVLSRCFEESNHRVVCRPGKYIYLGAGRGYLTSPHIGTWRVSDGVASQVEAAPDPHGTVSLLGCRDSGATATITDHMALLVELLNEQYTSSNQSPG